MTESRDKSTEAALESILAGARRAEGQPGTDLMQRLTADMESMLPTHQRNHAPAPAESVFGRFGRFFAASGLAGATALGIWIGFVIPETLNSVADGYSDVNLYGIEAFLPAAGLAALTE